jgi:uncharacterized protein YecE (DUF72 family)
MHFGRIGNIGEIDFSLPPDDKMTEELWLRRTPAGDEPPRIYVGCTEWGRKNWIGKVYPRGTKDKDFLAHYVRQFNTIELNALFYNLQPKPVIEKWASLADGGFRFCPKFTDVISHKQQLINVQRETDLFIDHMRSFGRSLGPCFLQLSESFGPDRAGVLQEYLRELPRDFRTCVELRQEGWFGGAHGGGTGVPANGGAVARAGLPHAVQETWQLLSELGIGSVITDTPGRRDVLHMRLTAPVAFIRYVGNNLHPTDHQRIDSWVDRIKSWIDKGLREVYFFIHNPEESFSPEMCRYVVEQFNKKCGSALKPPKILNEANLSLFD